MGTAKQGCSSASGGWRAGVRLFRVSACAAPCQQHVVLPGAALRYDRTAVRYHTVPGTSRLAAPSGSSQRWWSPPLAAGCPLARCCGGAARLMHWGAAAPCGNSSRRPSQVKGEGERCALKHRCCEPPGRESQQEQGSRSRGRQQHAAEQDRTAAFASARKSQEGGRTRTTIRPQAAQVGLAESAKANGGHTC